MNVLTLNNFHKICRTCAREEDELISFHENPYLAEMLKLCTQTEFETNDELPKQICLSCIDELNKTYTFTIKCKMVDAALRNFIREHNMANVEENIPSNSEFNVCIKTENCENPNDESVDTTNINCSQCNEVFTSLSDLIIHQKLERHFCNKEPNTEENNKRKRRSKKADGDLSEDYNAPQTPKKDRTFTCQICNKVMNNLSNFRRHEQIHSGEKKFQCDVCNKSFRHSGTLITHQRSHSGERPCVCDICGKTYVDLSTLGRHKKIHSGEKKFQCDVCSKRFTQSGDLNVHKRLHFEKPFSCEVCQKRFNRRTHLIKHGKVHLKKLLGQQQQGIAGNVEETAGHNQTSEFNETLDFNQTPEFNGSPDFNQTPELNGSPEIIEVNGIVDEMSNNDENEVNEEHNENEKNEENHEDEKNEENHEDEKMEESDV